MKITQVKFPRRNKKVKILLGKYKFSIFLQFFNWKNFCKPFFRLNILYFNHFFVSTFSTFSTLKTQIFTKIQFYRCSFATALASKYENNISQLVLISGGGPSPLAPPSHESVARCFLRAMLAPFLMCGLHRDILYSARGRQHPYGGPEPREQWPSHMKYVLNGMHWPDGDYVLHRRITTPTLLVHGLRDNSVSLVQECQMERVSWIPLSHRACAIKPLFPLQTMVKAFLEAMPMAGHTPMTDCPEQLNHMIHCFIDLYLWKNKKL